MLRKNACVHFVDERDFKEVSVVGKRKSKKNRKADLAAVQIASILKMDLEF